MRELQHVLRELEPPTGGLQRLQRTIETRGKPAHRHHSFAFGALACSALAMMLILLTLPNMLEKQKRTTALLDAMQNSVAPAGQGIRVDHGAALELPSGQANVRLYLIQSDAPSTH